MDGLRAIAVIAVLLFHADYLPNGYLGVDIFFVISGYLITRIIAQQLNEGSFSLLNFYERRIRRIVPMLLLVSIIALAIGYYTFLPDDLENLSESVIASNLFANNILLLLTRGYWDIANTYKPLVHTWSLGVEEQFYLVFPLILMGISKLRLSKNKTIVILGLLVILSISSNFIAQKNTFHFYSPTSRFYQLAIGALLVFIKPIIQSGINKAITFFSLCTVLLMLVIPHQLSPFTSSLIITIATALFIHCYSQSLIVIALEQPPIRFIGKISYSIYLWHQVVICYYKITVSDTITLASFAVITTLILLLSMATYYFVETPFRNKLTVNNKLLVTTLCFTTCITITAATILYLKKGIVKDVPEIDIYVNKPNNVNAYWQYNERVYKMDKPFANNGKRKLLVIGNSYARDFVNMLLENNYKDSFDISFKTSFIRPATKQRVQESDIIIAGNPIDSLSLNRFCSTNHLDKRKILVIGTKNFGANNNLLFNTLSPTDRCTARVNVVASYLKHNAAIKKEIGNNYVNLLALLQNDSQQVPVFTPDCKMIAQDYKHLTQYGAKYLGSLLIRDSAFKYFIRHLQEFSINQK